MDISFQNPLPHLAYSFTWAKHFPYTEKSSSCCCLSTKQHLCSRSLCQELSVSHYLWYMHGLDKTHPGKNLDIQSVKELNPIFHLKTLQMSVSISYLLTLLLIFLPFIQTNLKININLHLLNCGIIMLQRSGMNSSITAWFIYWKKTSSSRINLLCLFGKQRHINLTEDDSQV